MDFTTISLDEFITDSNEIFETGTGIVVFSEEQEKLVDEVRSRIEKDDPVHVEMYRRRISDLKTLASAIANFPSLLERSNMTLEERTPQLLIESLVNSKRDGDTTLQMPSKATLGRGFLVAKLHTFSNLEKLAKDAGLEERIVKQFHNETISMMFLLLAEDVYLNLIHDLSLPLDSRWQLATSLLLLWEHRADQNITDIAPVLRSVWLARTRLAPAFGTMMGTSELIMLSFQLDDQWQDFIKKRLGEEDVKMAMEEFLFGLSFEQITRLKSMLREKGINAIGRDEVSKYLDENVTTDVSSDYRDFFQQYTVRRDNARVRNRLGIAGPHRTLEDHFICFVMERNREKQRLDAASQEKSSN